MPCVIIPIAGQLDENMRRAVKRDAVKKEKFHFRKTIIPGKLVVS